jgi:RNA polymerase sigma-70 factor (ECF subfamily)
LSDLDEASELRLVLKSQAGDRSAFEQLVRRTARLVFARLYLETGRADQAEELSQETFLVAWRSIGQVTDPTGFRTWLLSVAHTVAIDALRRATRKKRSAAGGKVAAEALDAMADRRTPGPPQVAEREEARQRVLALLRELPEDYRLPLVLRYLHDYDYDTIGRQLGLTNGSLRGLLNRGMTMLRDRAAKAGLHWSGP